MKNKLLLLFSISLFITNAQLVVTKGDNTPINNGDVIGFAVTGEASNLNYKLVNTSNQPINVKIRCVSLLNTNGSNFEFCFDQCYNSVSAGTDYPNGAGAPAYDIVAANSTNSSGYHFKNFNPSTPANYVFRFFRVDSSGFPIGTGIDFTYRYDTALSVADIEKVNTLKGMGINLNNNSVTETMDFENSQNATMKIYDLSGKLVLENQLLVGAQSIQVSGLNSGIYMASFSNLEGQNATVKVVKR